MAQFSSVPPRSIFTGQKLVLRARLTFGDRTRFWDRNSRIGPILQRTPQEHFHRTKTRFKGAFDFWGQNWVLGQNSPNWPNSPAYPPSIFTGQKLVLRARLTLGTKLGPGSLFLILWGVSLSSTMGTMTFWERIPRIGPILQRTPQEHFHRTKTRFKGAFDFWGQNWVLGQNSPNWPNSPAYPPGAFSPDKNSF